MQEQLQVGDKGRNFRFLTPWEGEKDFFRETAGQYCCLIFLRYLGCTTCQLEIHELIRDYPLFAEKGANLYLVLQSTPERLRANTDRQDIPFTIICDPQQTLYKLYAIGSYDKDAPRSKRLEERIQQARSLGFSHGEFEGNEQQLPAAFVFNPQQTVLLAHYGKESIDLPSHQELLSYVK